MTKHKLDEEVEDILQHYGIKGMKWGVRKPSNLESSSNESSGGGGGEIDEETLLERLDDKIKDVTKALSNKLGEVSDSIKKLGSKLVNGLFGVKNIKDHKLEGKARDRIIEGMKKADQESKSNKSSGGRIELKSGKTKTSSNGKYTLRVVSDKEANDLINKYKKSGAKKHKRSSVPVTERYKFRTVSDKEYNSLVNKLKKEGYKKK